MLNNLFKLPPKWLSYDLKTTKTSEVFYRDRCVKILVVKIMLAHLIL